MTKTRILVYALLVLLIGILAAGCTAAAPGQAGQVDSTAAPAVASGEGEGEEGGVEAALVTYADKGQGFSIGHPGPWQLDAAVKEGVKFGGGDSSMTLELVDLAADVDAMAYAQNDVANLQAAFEGFKQVGLAPSTEVPGAVVLGFEASGKSVVTGKEFTAHNERYYIPVGGARLAVLTVVSPEKLYDREGVRDIALTLKMTE